MIAEVEAMLKSDGLERLIKLLPIQNNRERERWRTLQHEIRQFAEEGLLFPVTNGQLGKGDHYRNHSSVPDRKVPRLIFKKLFPLPYGVKKSLIPAVKSFYTIAANPPSQKKSWLKHTSYTRRKYDSWYWKMRLRTLPVTPSWQTLSREQNSKLMRKIHDYHARAAIERNARLKRPPAEFNLMSKC